MQITYTNRTVLPLNPAQVSLKLDPLHAAPRSVITHQHAKCLTGKGREQALFDNLCTHYTVNNNLVNLPTSHCIHAMRTLPWSKGKLFSLQYNLGNYKFAGSHRFHRFVRSQYV